MLAVEIENEFTIQNVSIKLCLKIIDSVMNKRFTIQNVSIKFFDAKMKNKRK